MKMYVDIEILADGSLVLYDAHRIAASQIERQLPQCKHCMVHVKIQWTSPFCIDGKMTKGTERRWSRLWNNTGWWIIIVAVLIVVGYLNGYYENTTIKESQKAFA